MYIFKRHNLGLILAILLLAMAVVSCRSETPPLASPATLSPAPTMTGTPGSETTPSLPEATVISTPPPDVSYLSAEPIEEQAQEALANWLGISSEEIEVVEIEEVEWPDTSLGCPEPGMAYAEVIVPGWRVVMGVGDEVYEYHSGGGQRVLCDGEGHPLPQVSSEPTVVVPTPLRGVIVPTPFSGHLEKLIQRAKEDLANRLEVSIEEIEVRYVEEAEWPDASLGCGDVRLVYRPITIHGYRIVLSVGGKNYEYHTDTESRVVYCPKVG